jgi:hypothetical protein
MAVGDGRTYNTIHNNYTWGPDILRHIGKGEGFHIAVRSGSVISHKTYLEA